MKKIITILMLFSVCLKAQDFRHIDSMLTKKQYYTVIAELSKFTDSYPDTTQVQIYDDLAQSYYYTLDFTNAKSYTIKSYDMYVKIGNHVQANKKLITLGVIYLGTNDYAQAKKYFDRSLLKCDNTDDKYYVYGGYIDYYTHFKKYDSSMIYINMCLAINAKDPYTHLSLAKLYVAQNKCDNGIDTYKKILSYDINQSLKNECYAEIAKLYKNDSKLAIAYLDSVDTGILEYAIIKCQVLIDIYKNEHILDSVCFYSNKLMLLKDSMTQFNINEKSEQLSAEFDSKYHVKEAEQEIQTKKEHTHTLNIVILICIIIIIMTVIVLFWVKRQKDINDKLAHTIKEKNKEIIDSINYAKGIQESILPVKLDNAFVLFKPKDIVSGDFYWAFEKNGIRYYAVADCTGHGVPGALLSMLCSRLLDEAIVIYKEPFTIIKWVKEELEKHMSRLGRNDSMEIGLVSIDLRDMMSYYGIKRPLYIVTKDGLEECKVNDNDMIYKQLNKGDMLYISTDGYVDQFGTGGKKYSSKRLKSFLVTLNDLSMQNKQLALSVNMKSWMGSNEQIDDILIMGIQLP